MPASFQLRVCREHDRICQGAAQSGLVALRQGVSTDVQADKEVGLKFLYCDFQSLHHAVYATVDVDKQNLFAMDRRHLRLGKKDSCLGLAFWICHPDTGMENADIFDFAQ